MLSNYWLKESVIPSAGNKFIFIIAPGITFFLSLIGNGEALMIHSFLRAGCGPSAIGIIFLLHRSVKDPTWNDDAAI